MEDISVESAVISDEELKSLTDAINQRHGIDFSCYETKSLKRRVGKAMSVFNINSMHELWVKILRERDFIYPFMDEISVGLTSMFRDPVLWKKLKEVLTNEWAKRRDLIIWHSGCSSGEEVYTMGIVIKESKFSGRVSATATDISMQSIEKAKKGEYHSLKIDEYEKNLRIYNPESRLSNYSKEVDKSLLMNKDLINHVAFEYHNLITDPFIKKYDIIFCRNVMIYFDNGAKRKLMDKFHDSLNQGGFLIIGFYDAIMQLVDITKFKIYDAESKIFQKM